ncbi:hypothetical protein MCHI_002219 [Candidatus Magnetoovum chiemensis]|nr:hypothetical protein MCHI_002219 [Candidatus Magnetoovum chiemensis]
MLTILTALIFIFIPSISYAWGPLTHVYLGSEVFSFSSLIPAAIYSIIRTYKQDFLYGNIMADIVIGKKYLPRDKNSHTWNFGFGLIDSSRDDDKKRAFSYGYLCHLAADSIIHEILTNDTKNIAHTIYELKADSFISKRYWLTAVAIGKAVQKRNDKFLKNSLDRYFLTFKLNKRIFKSIIYFSILNSNSIIDKLESRTLVSYVPDRHIIENLLEKSLLAMLDVLVNGKASHVLERDPFGAIT